MSLRNDPGTQPAGADLILPSEIVPICGDLDATHGRMEPTVGAVMESDHRGYGYRCTVCKAEVTVVLPVPGSATEREIVPLKHETELMPDDGVSLAAIGFRCSRWRDHGYMRRISKETIPGAAVPKTDYLYRCGCSKIRLVVDRASGATRAKA